MIECKEVIVIHNDDDTYKLECIGCKFMNNGEEVEAKIVFPKLLTVVADVTVNERGNKNINIFDFTPAVSDGESEIFTVIIEK